MKQRRNKSGGNVYRQDDQNDRQAEKACARYSYDLYCVAIFLTKYPVKAICLSDPIYQNPRCSRPVKLSVVPSQSVPIGMRLWTRKT